MAERGGGKVVDGSNGWEGRRKDCGWEVMAGRGDGKTVGGK
jgi:hypothetical protein